MSKWVAVKARAAAASTKEIASVSHGRPQASRTAAATGAVMRRGAGAGGEGLVGMARPLGWAAHLAPQLTPLPRGLARHYISGAPLGRRLEDPGMRTGMILAVVAVCAAASACSKKSSLYLEPGGAATPAKAPAAAPAPIAPSQDVHKASDVTPERR